MLWTFHDFLIFEFWLKEKTSKEKNIRKAKSSISGHQKVTFTPLNLNFSMLNLRLGGNNVLHHARSKSPAIINP